MNCHNMHHVELKYLTDTKRPMAKRTASDGTRWHLHKVRAIWKQGSDTVAGNEGEVWVNPDWADEVIVRQSEALSLMRGIDGIPTGVRQWSGDRDASRVVQVPRDHVPGDRNRKHLTLDSVIYYVNWRKGLDAPPPTAAWMFDDIDQANKAGVLL